MPAVEARDQLLVFLFAGHDTTASVLTFAMHLLGGHPEIQDRAADEVRQVLAGRPPTVDDLTGLPHLGQVLKEALRLYPSAYATSRRVTEADVVSGHRLPAGAAVLQRFRLTTDARPVPVTPRVTLHPLTAVPCRLDPRGRPPKAANPPAATPRAGIPPST